MSIFSEKVPLKNKFLKSTFSGAKKTHQKPISKYYILKIITETCVLQIRKIFTNVLLDTSNKILKITLKCRSF